MSLPLLIATCAFLFFGILTISSSIREEKLKKRIRELETEHEHRELEERLLTEIYNNLHHTSDVTGIVELIASYVRSLLPCTTIASLTIHPHKMHISILAIEQVSHTYIDEVKAMTLHSLTVHDKIQTDETLLTEHVSGEISEKSRKVKVVESFQLPLMIHNSVAAIITVTASESGRFPHQTLASLQRIIKHTGKTMSKLDTAFEIEKSRMSGIIESLNDGLLMVDNQKQLHFINSAAKKLLRLYHDNPTTLDVLSSFPISHDFVGKLQAALDENKHTQVASISLHNKLVTITITPVTTAAGKPLGASVLIQDDTLAHSVPRMKEDFTNIIIHHLRSPLTTIKASSQLLNSRTDLIPEEQKKLTQLIFQQSDKLLTEVQEILDAAKLEAGVFILHKKPHDLAQVIKSICDNFKPQAQHKMIHLSTDLDPRLPHFTFDREQITHVITNILSNSFKFTPTGGRIQVTAKPKSDKVILTVSDSGIGIAKDKQHLLFRKFSQVSDAGANVGTGLGLFVVKGVVEAHNGTIHLDSDIGRGTTITMTLPLLHPTHHSEAELGDSTPPQRTIN